MKACQSMLSPFLTTISLLLLLFLLGGCGTTMEVQYPVNQDASEAHQPAVFKSVTIKVKSEVPETEEAEKQLNFAMEVELLYKKKKIVKSGGDIILAVVIKSLRDVPRESRVWFGSLAGNAEMRTDVTVKGGGLPPRLFTVETTTRGAASTDDFLTGKGGSTQDMLERTAQAIVEELIPE
jgi:hypothetical protein